MLEKEKE